jgi:hypothetical protein
MDLSLRQHRNSGSMVNASRAVRRLRACSTAGARA